MLLNRYEWWIAWRYTRFSASVSKSRFVSFVAGLSILGIAVGVAALIIVLSVMNGFQRDVRDRMLSVLPHVEIFSLDGKALMNWQSISEKMAENPAILASAPFVNGQAMLSYADAVSGVVVKGIDPLWEDAVSDTANQMRVGTLKDLHEGSFSIVLGRDLAYKLGVQVGSKISMIVPQAAISPVGFVPRIRVFYVVGILESGHFEYDTNFAWIHIRDAVALFQTGGVQGLRIKLKNLHEARSMRAQLAIELERSFPTQVFSFSDWTQQNKIWFDAVQIEKRMMSIILSIIVAIAAFNLLSSLVMVVAEKRSAIAILVTLGAKPFSIVSIFLLQGAVAGIIGTFSGTLFGTLVAFNIDVILPWLERMFAFELLPKGIYLINQLPSDPRLSDIVAIVCTALLLSLLATLYPSYRAAKVEPARALRFE